MPLWHSTSSEKHTNPLCSNPDTAASSTVIFAFFDVCQISGFLFKSITTANKIELGHVLNRFAKSYFHEDLTKKYSKLK